MELYLPYAPVATRVTADVRTLTIILVVGLAIFYGVLFRFIAAASRRLQRQSEELRISADRDRHQATHGALTGLPSWELLRDRLQQGLSAATRSDDEIALLLIDLDRFKEINDSLGHSYGDKLLCQVGPRLRSVLRDGDTVARLGGDEFAVLLPSVDGVSEAQAVAERLRPMPRARSVPEPDPPHEEVSAGRRSVPLQWGPRVRRGPRPLVAALPSTATRGWDALPRWSSSDRRARPPALPR